MCGIAAFLSQKNDCREYLDKALQVLTLRGYDSWGCLIDSETHQHCWSKYIGEYKSGTIPKIGLSKNYTLGLAHTRWATNGKVTLQNTHPHIRGDIAIVHNGILGLIPEEYMSDTEYIVKYLYEGRVNQSSFNELKEKHKEIGAVVGISGNMLFAYTDSSPLYVGYQNENVYISSEVCALPENTSVVKLLDKNKLHHWTLSGKTNESGQKMDVKIEEIKPVSMLDEIYQQIDLLDKEYPENSYSRIYLSSSTNTTLVGCGSSYYAAKFISQYLSDVPVYAIHPYELKDIDLNNDIILISQSGETKDIINLIERYPSSYFQLVTNNKYSTAANLLKPNRVFDIQAGKEWSVAATKTFFATILAFLPTLDRKQIKDSIQEIFDNQDLIKKLSVDVARYSNILILGQGLDFPICEELALKFKEVCQIHAEAVESSEIKHGPIALIDGNVLTILVGENKKAKDEVLAREGKIVEISYSHPLANLVFGQLLVYYTAKCKGLNPERPRSLAKSVTV